MREIPVLIWYYLFPRAYILYMYLQIWYFKLHLPITEWLNLGFPNESVKHNNHLNTTYMKIAITICRSLLGAAFLFFGLNILFHFLPMPAPQGDVKTFMEGMMATKYFMPMLGTFQALCGLCLLINKFVPLALTILFAINLNIVLFHMSLDPGGLGMGLFLMLLNIFLIYAYRNHFLHLSNHSVDHSHK